MNRIGINDFFHFALADCIPYELDKRRAIETNLFNMGVHGP